MAIDFPNNPQENDLFSQGGTTWIYKSPSWNLYSGTGFVTTGQLSSNLTGYVTASVLTTTISNNRNKYAFVEPIATYTGQIWIDASSNPALIKVYNGTAWVSVGPTVPSADDDQNILANQVFR